MARAHLQKMLQMQDTTQIVAITEPAAAQLELTRLLFERTGMPMPPVGSDLETTLREHSGEFDVALIVTPHVFHLGQATLCLESGLDVLLEKPMVLTADEAKSLIATRDRTRRLLVVAFPGSLSPQIREAVRMLRAGELGVLHNIVGTAWQSWKSNTTNTWRQVPEMAGGGFMFDTGAHLLNTSSDLAGEDFVEVAAWLDNRGAPVDIIGIVMAKLRSGGYVTLTGSGDLNSGIGSEIRVICSDGMLRTGIWGERLEVKRPKYKTMRAVKLPPTLGVWEQFLDVRNGKMPNPCPPEVGLRMARLWDGIQASARLGGKPIQIKAEG